MRPPADRGPDAEAAQLLKEVAELCGAHYVDSVARALRPAAKNDTAARAHRSYTAGNTINSSHTLRNHTHTLYSAETG